MLKVKRVKEVSRFAIPGQYLGFVPYILNLEKRDTNWIGMFKNGFRFLISDRILGEMVQSGKSVI